jgi:tetratricopeptide (TPR) repeat protein
MKVSDFTNLLEYPGKLNSPIQTHQLEEVLGAYPWFQAARALHLKGLKNLNSYKYNQALKRTAAYTTDRDVLFDFITSEVFNQNAVADAISGKASIKAIEVIVEEVHPDTENPVEIMESPDDGPLPRSSKDAENILDPGLFTAADPEIAEELQQQAAAQEASETLKIGQPLEFKKDERHSFSQWLQLTSFQKDTGTETVSPAAVAQSKPQELRGRNKKFELIDRFIETNPKIVPKRDADDVPLPAQKNASLDKSELMTETLARIYLEQGKFKEALQAYRILILKYPEKSSFFADQIKAVEKLRDIKNKK